MAKCAFRTASVLRRGIRRGRTVHSLLFPAVAPHVECAAGRLRLWKGVDGRCPASGVRNLLEEVRVDEARVVPVVHPATDAAVGRNGNHLRELLLLTLELGLRMHELDEPVLVRFEQMLGYHAVVIELRVAQRCTCRCFPFRLRRQTINVRCCAKATKPRRAVVQIMMVENVANCLLPIIIGFLSGSPLLPMDAIFFTNGVLFGVAGRGNARPPTSDCEDARHSVAAAFRMACRPCRRYA